MTQVYPIVGRRVKHIKRGSSYLIIGWGIWDRTLRDQDQAVFAFINGGNSIIMPIEGAAYGANLALPLLFQRSIEPPEVGLNKLNAFVYRSNDGAVYARPSYEFTSDRFEVDE